MQSFVYSSVPCKVVFGEGAIQLVAEELQALGCSRALVITTAFQKKDGEKLATELGDLSVGVFSNATMHTPIDVTAQALKLFEESGADCVVALGGGSTIGLGKAIAWRNDAPQLVVATTYAGSEVTDILGQTENGVKTTVRDPRIRPETVIYDPALTLALPVDMSVVSGLNAMAHAAEGLYAPDVNPIVSLSSMEGLKALKEALPRIVKNPEDLEARSKALFGSWLCGSVLGSAAMSLHHKLCHTLGGACDLPHAETHAVLLPHTVAYNADAAAHQLRNAADLFGGDLGGGLFDFAQSLGAPTSLRSLGLAEDEIEDLADLATANPYQNPRKVTKQGVAQILKDAFRGLRPGK